jgi:hypothetical protein
MFSYFSGWVLEPEEEGESDLATAGPARFIYNVFMYISDTVTVRSIPPPPAESTPTRAFIPPRPAQKGQLSDKPT